MTRIIDLNGLWRFAPELEHRPTNAHNLTVGDVNVHAYENICRRHWKWVHVPGVWERYEEQYRIYDGVCWYCKEIKLKDISEQTKARIRFKGVAYRADVFVNGIFVGYHESSYTEFTVDVTGLLRNGNNVIAVMVDNRAMMTKWPNDRGYFNYGGIHRDVSLELMDDTYMDELSLVPTFDYKTGTGVLDVSCKVFGETATKVTVTMGTKTTQLIADTNGTLTVQLRYPDVIPWSPNAPKLYSLTIMLGEEIVASKKIGFKTIETEGTTVLLNGEKIRLNGTCYVYDSPVYGLVMTKEQLEMDLGEMKAAGVNAIRTHFPMDDRFYRMCDEMGFLVWIEIPVYTYKPKVETNSFFAQPAYVENACMMIREMIDAAKEYACIAIYSIGNECGVEHPEAEPFFRLMAETVRQYDNTKLVGYACLYGMVGPIGKYVDILGVNSYVGWYDKISDIYTPQTRPVIDGKVEVEPCDLTEFHNTMDQVMGKLPKELPLLLTEFGGDCVPGFFSSSLDMWSENYHAKVIKEMIAASYDHAEICGTFVFAFTDYIDPCKPYNGFWNGLNLKGMLSYNRARKLPFYAMQEMYGGREE